ncbi:hypothetical protein KSP40_PGU004723 [Platanthera guangdongensis]|uniref:Uncharacterized protein n=1 Tax=Platanthera guangdongensis TaxID=2320717 RepID=A0ABR2MME0_9ASPA
MKGCWSRIADQRTTTKQAKWVSHRLGRTTGNGLSEPSGAGGEVAEPLGVTFVSIVPKEERACNRMRCDHSWRGRPSRRQGVRVNNNQGELTSTKTGGKLWQTSVSSGQQSRGDKGGVGRADNKGSGGLPADNRDLGGHHEAKVRAENMGGGQQRIVEVSFVELRNRSIPTITVNSVQFDEDRGMSSLYFLELFFQAMVARGDLGAELPIEEVPLLQPSSLSPIPPPLDLPSSPSSQGRRPSPLPDRIPAPPKQQPDCFSPKTSPDLDFPARSSRPAFFPFVAITPHHVEPPPNLLPPLDLPRSGHFSPEPALHPRSSPPNLQPAFPLLDPVSPITGTPLLALQRHRLFPPSRPHTRTTQTSNELFFLQNQSRSGLSSQIESPRLFPFAAITPHHVELPPNLLPPLDLPTPIPDPALPTSNQPSPYSILSPPSPEPLF